jgi:hypothetical protein
MENTVAQEQPRQAELTIVDLSNLRSVVELAVRRGTFQASELSSVGVVYDKLNNFLNSVASAQPTEQKEAQ